MLRCFSPSEWKYFFNLARQRLSAMPFDYFTFLRCSSRDEFIASRKCLCTRKIYVHSFFHYQFYSSFFTGDYRASGSHTKMGSSGYTWWVSSVIADAEKRISNDSVFNWISSIRRTFCCLNVLVMVSTWRCRALAPIACQHQSQRSQKRIA